MNLIKQVLLLGVLILGMSVAGTSQAVLFEEQFDGGLNGWTVESNFCTDNSDPDPANWSVDSTCTTALWEYSATGEGNGSFWGTQTPFASPSAANGCVLFDSDFLDTQAGGINASGTGPAPNGYNTVNATRHGHSGTIISPVLDLTNGGTISPTSVSLNFNQHYRALAGVFSYSISSDGGTTWTRTEINGDFTPNNLSDNPLLYIANVTSQVIGDLTNVRIKFTFTGGFYYWMLDDIMFTEGLKSNTGIDADYAAVPTNYETPISQAEPNFLAARVLNSGVEAQTNVKLKAEVIRDGTLEFADSIVLATMDPESDSIVTFMSTYTPQSLGNYNLVYTVSQDSADQETSDNSVSFPFVMGENLYRKDAPGGVSGFRLGGATAYEFGTQYHFVSGNGSTYKVNEISFAHNSFEELFSIGESLTVNLKRWDDTNANDDIDAGELTTVGFATYTPDASVSNNDVVTVPILDFATTLPGVTLNDNTSYIPSIAYSGTGDTFMAFGMSRDYDATLDVSSNAGSTRASMTIDDAIGGFAGSGDKAVPIVRMVIDLFNSIEQTPLAESQVNVFPNPTNGQISVKVELNDVANEVNYTISDISGKVLVEASRNNIQNETVNFNVADFAAGTYLISVRTPEGVKTVSFVKQ